MKYHNYYATIKINRINDNSKNSIIEVNTIISTEKKYLSLDIIERSKFGFINKFCEDNNIPKDTIVNIVISSLSYIGECTEEELYSSE